MQQLQVSLATLLLLPPPPPPLLQLLLLLLLLLLMPCHSVGTTGCPSSQPRLPPVGGGGRGAPCRSRCRLGPWPLATETPGPQAQGLLVGAV